MSAPRPDVIQTATNALLDVLESPVYKLSLSEMLSASYTLTRCLIASTIKHHPELAPVLGEALYPLIAECTVVPPRES